MFQQECSTQVEQFLAVSSPLQLNGLLAIFDHLPAQIGSIDAIGTQGGHLGRPNG